MLGNYLHFPIHSVNSLKMTGSAGKGTPEEFGRALATAREKAGVTLEDLVARTKISRRMLEGLEQGAFSRLPGETFARLFLRQYLELIGEPLEPWMSRFAVAWERADEERTSGSIPVVATPVVREGRVWAWIVGVLLVLATLAGVAVLQRIRGEGQAVPAPTPTAVLTLVTPVALATATPSAAPEMVAPPCVLSLQAGERPCWVEVRDESGARQSRLLTAGERWDWPGAVGTVELVIGDAGALQVCFHGTTLAALGGRGEVVRLRLDPAEYTRGASRE